MSSEIRPTEVTDENAAFKFWILSVEEMLNRDDINLEAKKFLNGSLKGLANWLITGDNQPMNECISALVSAVIYDPEVSPVLGGYIDWARKVVEARA